VVLDIDMLKLGGHLWSFAIDQADRLLVVALNRWLVSDI
jgi:hypothetical protein